MRPDGLFLSFAAVTPGRHQEYNAWHQLDHRPENLLLPGVLAGERWVRTPECASAFPVADPALAGTHYVNSYWFRPPVAQSLADWQRLAELSFQQGRRPDVRIATRPMMGLWSPVSGWAADRVAVSPEALLLRPSRGVVLSLLRLEDPKSPPAEAWLGERERLCRELVAVDGVAGVWTASSTSTTLDPSWSPKAASTTFDPAPRDAGAIRAELVVLDGNPWSMADRLPVVERGPAEDLFTSLLLPIRPWEWDWFDADATVAEGG
jgi:hypothetical protein